MGSNYWTRHRLTRRRVVAGAGASGLALAAASLVGCGDDTSTEGTSQEARGLISARVDTTRSAKRGGVLQDASGEPSTFDTMPAPNSASNATAANYVYSRLTKYKAGVIEPATGEIEGDLAESWEVSGDKLTLTFKLRPNAKFDRRPPTNGRAVEAKDVLYSLERFKSLSTFRTELFRIEDSLGPIESFSSPDARTVVLKLAEPDALSLQLLTNPRYLYIQPVESDGGYNIASDARGSGPFTLKEWRPSDRMEFERNPDWHGSENGRLPYLDAISYPFLTEYAALLAQFQAKNVWLGNFVRKEDIVGVKTTHPEMVLLEGEFPRAATRWFPGILPDSPFRDERVRQAVSMALDRELIMDVFDNVVELEGQGLPLEVRYNTSIACGWDGAWLDPLSSSFGPNAKYFKYDPAEAKALLSAAGFPNGFEYDFHFRAPPGYGAAYNKWVEVLSGSLNEVGMRANLLSEDYNSIFLPGNRTEGMFTGARMIATSTQGDPVEMISNHYHSAGGFGIHQPPPTPERDLDTMIESMRKEFDLDKRLELIHEFQRIMAKRQRVLLFVGATPSLTLNWPWVGNYGVYRSYNGLGAGTESMVHLWYDESKRT